VSLRSRVALLILALLVAGMTATLLRALRDAQNQVSERLIFTQSLTVELLRLVHSAAGEPGMPELSGELMGRLTMLQEDGYVGIVIDNSADRPNAANLRALRADDVPRWFAHLMGIGDNVFSRQIGTYRGMPVMVSTDPGGQLMQIWNDTKATVIAQMGILLLLNIVIYLMLGRWLNPIERIVGGLHEIEKGDYSGHIKPSGLPELDQITRNVNRLTDVLAASKSENERLQSQAISTQEQERHRLAQELHDSLGQAISAIKAVAVSIGIRSREQLPDIAFSAQSIEKISENAYKAVRELMTALHPSVLDELGLATALEQMVEDWNHHHEAVFCRLEIDGSIDDLDEDQTINVYRIIQESLTNVVKHARATQVEVRFGGAETLKLAICDNGAGFDPASGKRGMGLWNIKDRVNLLHGKLQIDAKPGKGVGLYIEFPRHYVQREQAI